MLPEQEQTPPHCASHFIAALAVASVHTRTAILLLTRGQILSRTTDSFVLQSVRTLRAALWPATLYSGCYTR